MRWLPTVGPSASVRAIFLAVAMMIGSVRASNLSVLAFLTGRSLAQ